MKVLLIIPCYNEEKSILKVCNDINEYNDKFNTNYDIMVINDGSTDGTEDILINNNIKHIKLIHNLGIGGAVQTGYKYANEFNYDIAVQFDGDGQHNVEFVKNLINPIIKGECNMVIGSRFVENRDNFKSSKARRIGIKIISLFIKFVTKNKIYDTTSGMRAIDNVIINEFANNYPVEYPEPVSTTIVLKKNYKVKEVFVKMNERTTGVSSIKAWKNCYYMMNVVLSIIVIKFRRYK